jgi:hypothetical protein
MYAFHESHFGEMDAPGMERDKTRLVQFFNKMGRSRRRHVLRPDRSFAYTSLIYNSELQRIAAGMEVYRGILRSVRKRCLESLASIITKPALRMNLIVVDDVKAAKVKARLHDYETMGAVGELFSIWNYHSGSIGWSEHPKYVSYHKNLLEQIQRYALFGSCRETAQYITASALTT